MTKTTKVALSVAILGAGGYLLYKNFKKPAPAAAFAGGVMNPAMGPRKKHNLGKGFAGNGSSAASTVVGKRVQMSGTMYANTLGGNIVDAQASSWVRGASNIRQGGNGAPTQFFQPHSSGWVRG